MWWPLVIKVHLARDPERRRRRRYWKLRERCKREGTKFIPNRPFSLELFFEEYTPRIKGGIILTSYNPANLFGYLRAGCDDTDVPFVEFSEDPEGPYVRREDCQ